MCDIFIGEIFRAMACILNTRIFFSFKLLSEEAVQYLVFEFTSASPCGEVSLNANFQWTAVN